MNKLPEYRRLLRNRLSTKYDKREAASIVDLILEAVLGLTKSKILSPESFALSDDQAGELDQMISRLLIGEPVQYVIGSCHFMGMEFEVNSNVLIPRPETEELVNWIQQSMTQPQKIIQILDIGTGSGCIAIALKKYAGASDVTAIDISKEALDVASRNAVKAGVRISFRQLDFLDTGQQNSLVTGWDVIVSNPPYITNSESASLPENVRDFEPHIALFCNDDPLLFYSAIGHFGLAHLNKQGKLYFEIHEDHAEAVNNLLVEMGFGLVEIRSDINDKPRMICASK